MFVNIQIMMFYYHDPCSHWLLGSYILVAVDNACGHSCSRVYRTAIYKKGSPCMHLIKYQQLLWLLKIEV